MLSRVRRTRHAIAFLLPLAFTLTRADEAVAQLSPRDAVGRVLQWLDMYGEEYAPVPESGQWGLVFGWFEEGEAKELSFSATGGKVYRVAGAGDANSQDLDLCVYDGSGQELACDTGTDNIPLVTFTAKSTGRYRVVLTAYRISGNSTFAGMVLLRSKVGW